MAGGDHRGQLGVYLAVFLQNGWCNLRVFLHQLEQWVFGNFRSRRGEVHQGFETWICLSQDSVAVSRHDLAGFKRAPKVVLYLSVCK